MYSGNTRMTTLKDTLKPTEKELDAVLSSALHGRDEERYIDDYLKALLRCINDDARYYRSFGPWWPSLKKMLVEAELITADAEIDIDVSAIYRYDKDVHTLLAAVLYHNMRFSAGALMASLHQLEVIEGGDEDGYDYESYDLELERRVSGID